MKQNPRDDAPTHHGRRTCAALAAAAIVGGLCMLSASPALAEGEPSAEAAAEAKQVYETRCFACHGMTGKGDGPGAAALDPKPRDLTLAEWQTSVDDEYIAKIIELGGTGVGKSALMPPNPDLTAKPEVIQALVVYVRGLGAE